jgi:class 3 adenylate cyclase
MFTDIVGSTNLIEAIGDEAWEDVLHRHDETLRTQIGAHRGRVVHSTGDGFVASFEETSDGLTCAVAIQRVLSELRGRDGFVLQVRIGLHAAEATEVADDYAGIGVHEAARVGALADGGEILVTVSSLEPDGSAFAIGEEREVALKGIAQPVRVAPVEWRSDA